jgi:8-oxo-dGTP pyrophosphatase MutT (NUDIX family)
MAMKERFKMIIAVHLFLLNNNKILLQKRCNTGYEDGNYSVIAGHVEGNEKLTTAMIREAQEETGILIKENALEFIGVIHLYSKDGEWLDFFFKCQNWQNEIVNAEPHKCSELKWFKINSLPQNTVSYVRKAIENFNNNIMLDYHGW